MASLACLILCQWDGGGRGCDFTHYIHMIILTPLTQSKLMKFILVAIDSISILIPCTFCLQQQKSFKYVLNLLINVLKLLKKKISVMYNFISIVLIFHRLIEKGLITRYNNTTFPLNVQQHPNEPTITIKAPTAIKIHGESL